MKAEEVKVKDRPNEADTDNEPGADDLRKKRKQLKRAERNMRDIHIFGFRALIFIFLIWVLFFFIIGFATMPSGDMYPRIDGGDLLLFYRLDKDVRAQDVIVFTKDDVRYVGRVVAKAGDTVEITDGENLVVNGNTMIESNIFSSTPRYEGFVDYPLKLGPDECFVLADHRQGGVDSRFFGPVSKSEIAGTVISVLRRNNL